MTILLCTTGDFLLTSLEYRFRKNGWQLEVAHDVKQAGQKTKELLPGLIVVDLELPEYEGLDIIQTLVKETMSQIPILVGAPLEKGSLLMEGLRLGATDFIITPFKPDELVLRIRHILQMAKVAR